MKTYEEIKLELLEIAKILKNYPEGIQPKVFEILTNHFLGHSATSPHSDLKEPTKQGSETSPGKTAKPKTNSKTASKSKDNLTLLKELNLRPTGKKSFKDFFDEKKPSSAGEFNTVAVYYLSEMLSLPNITPNHIYTCYKEVSKRPPEAFAQSLRDTASKHGYIDTSDSNNIKVPLRGKNFIEHDLPKTQKQKSKK